MMRLWLETYGKSTAVSQSAVLSVLAHAVLIAGAVSATAKAPNVPKETLANRVYFIPPPDRVPRQQGSRESLRYFELAPEGSGAGLGVPMLEGAREFTEIDRSPPGDLGTELQSAPEAAPIPSQDTVLSVLEVDSAAIRDPQSAAPAYPVELLKEGVQGSVYTQYVVDTTGFADSTSLKILRSSHPQFTASVREALPYMRFSPARLGPRKVRQLVEQEFTFRIQQAGVVPDSVARSGKPIP
jgi:hypothetical protein